YDIFRAEIVKGNARLVNSHISANIISAYTSCMKCQTVQAIVEFPTPSYAGDVLSVDLNKSSDGSLTVSDQPFYSVSSSIHNLNSTLQISSQFQDSQVNLVSFSTFNK